VVLVTLLFVGSVNAQSEETIAPDDPVVTLKLSQCRSDFAMCEGQKSDLQKSYDELSTSGRDVRDSIPPHLFEEMQNKIATCEAQSSQLEDDLIQCRAKLVDETVPKDPLVLPLCVECSGQIEENERLNKALSEALAEKDALAEKLRVAGEQQNISEADEAAKRALESRIAELEAEIAELKSLLEKMRALDGDVDALTRKNAELSDELLRYKRRLEELGKSLEAGFSYYQESTAESYLELDGLSDLPAGTARLKAEQCQDAMNWLSSSKPDELPFGLEAWAWTGSDWLVCIRDFDGSAKTVRPNPGEPAHVLIFE
jgi:DNA repair exonuclease SbcCD ATPase subunit